MSANKRTRADDVRVTRQRRKYAPGAIINAIKSPRRVSEQQRLGAAKNFPGTHPPSRLYLTTRGASAAIPLICSRGWSLLIYSRLDGHLESAFSRPVVSSIRGEGVVECKREIASSIARETSNFRELRKRCRRVRYYISRRLRAITRIIQLRSSSAAARCIFL